MPHKAGRLCVRAASTIRTQAGGGLILRGAGQGTPRTGTTATAEPQKARQRSLARSALVEAVEQITLALDPIATLPATPVLRSEQIKLQVALTNTLFHAAAAKTKAAAERM
jgi:hypothetical protein